MKLLTFVLLAILSQIILAANKMPDIDWPKRFTYSATVKKEGDKRYRLKGFSGEKTESLHAYYSIMNYKYEQEKGKNKYLEAANFGNDNDFYFLKVDQRERECIKDDKKVANLRSLEDLVKLVLDAYPKKEQWEEVPNTQYCFSPKPSITTASVLSTNTPKGSTTPLPETTSTAPIETTTTLTTEASTTSMAETTTEAMNLNDSNEELMTDTMICFARLVYPVYPTSVKSKAGTVEIDIDSILMAAQDYPTNDDVPPGGYYCEGLGEELDNPPVFPNNTLFLGEYFETSPFGDGSGGLKVAMDIDKSFGMIEFQSHDPEREKDNYHIIYDLELGIQYKTVNGECNINGIDLNTDFFATSFVTPVEPGSTYSMRKNLLLFEYLEKDYRTLTIGQLGAQNLVKVKLYSKNKAGQVIAIIFDYAKPKDEKSAGQVIAVHAIHLYDRRHASDSFIRMNNFFPINDFLLENNPFACYSKLEEEPVPMHLTFKVESQHRGKINLGANKVEIQNAILTYLMSMMWIGHIRPQRYELSDRLEFPNQNEVAFYADIYPKIPDNRTYVYRLNSELEGTKTEQYTFKPLEAHSIETCIEECENRVAHGIECDGVYFKALTQTEVTCNFILEAFNPEKLVSTSEDFTVAFRPMRPSMPQYTTQKFVHGLIDLARNDDKLEAITVDAVPQFKLIYEDAKSDVYGEDSAKLQNIDLMSSGNVVRNSFKDILKRQLSRDSVMVEYGFTYLEQCAAACLRAHRHRGECNLFDFNYLNGECRFGLVDKATTEYSNERNLYYYDLAFMFHVMSDQERAPDYYLAAEQVTETACAQLCVENSKMGIEGHTVQEFPRANVCYGYQYIAAERKCYLYDSSIGGKTLKASNPKMLENLAENNQTINKRDFETNFRAEGMLDLDEFPEGWTSEGLGDQQFCSEACFRKWGWDCASITICNGQSDSLCFVFPSNQSYLHLFQPNKQSKYRCQIEYTHGRVPIPKLTSIVRHTKDEFIMSTVGLVFLAIFMFLIGAAIAVVGFKLLRR